MNAHASSLAMLYVAAAIGGTGAGAVYGTAVGNSLKWFTDRRAVAARARLENTEVVVLEGDPEGGWRTLSWGGRDLS